MACSIVPQKTSYFLSNIFHAKKCPGLPSYCMILKRNYVSQKKLERDEQIKETVFKYAGVHAKRANRVYGWGYAATGALGVKTFVKPDKRQKPRKIQFAPHRLTFFDQYKLKVHEVGCGYGFSVFLCHTENTGNLVYGTGINTDSQLGHQEYPRNSGRILDFLIEPAKIELPLTNPETTKLTGVACGRAHTVILTDEGVYSLGNNSQGQCGRNIVEGEEFRGNPIINKVNIDASVKKVICGQDHTLFLTKSGEVYSCGLGADGQTGQGHFDRVDVPTKVQGDIEGENIVHISSKADCVLAVSDKGDLFGWGNSEYNQLASVEPDTTQVKYARRLPFTKIGKAVRAAAGGAMCAVLNEEGQVFVWGFGILGKGPNLEESPWPTKIPETLFGKNEFSPDVKVVDIDCGINHFFAKNSAGELLSWGRNKTGCLGLANSIDQFFPLKAQVPAEIDKMGCGVDHTVVLCKAFA